MSGTGKSILIVEDNVKLARALREALLEEGYGVTHVTTGEAAIERISSQYFDAVVLDWMLPNMDGIAVCRQLRSVAPSPAILMLSARSEVDDRVLGLDAGADDYLPKPFKLQELFARLRALLRRQADGEQRPMVVGPLTLPIGDLAVVIAGKTVELTVREHSLLRCLARAKGRVVTRPELLQQVWRIDFEPGTNVIDVQVRRLREKLGAQGHLIETVRGSGYRLRVPEEHP